MNNRISKFLGGAFALAFLAWSIGARGEPAYPERAITVVVPFSAGSASDTYARLIGARLGEALGQSVVVENKDGAGGFIGAQYVLRAKPDGYTLLFAASPWAYTPYFFKRTPYDPSKDFVAVAKVGAAPSVLVAAADAPFGDVAGMAEYARQNPGKLTYSSAGIGTYSHLIGALVEKKLGVSMMHVPYKSAAQAMSDVVGHMISLNYPSLSAALPLIKAGKLKALGVTSLAPAAIAPDIPPLASQGMPGFEVMQWFGFVAPTGTSPRIVELLNTRINRVLAEPDVAARFAQLGIQLTPESPAGFSSDIDGEIKKWVPLGKELSITYD
ncbi:Bug family tripartite tricarboxylate transporter substrate binding protein [Bordetella genomosp. 9]|uniref:Bug family tripartite tricarboxylate transporter substrate binding protein n=1 Tax=Bordetella genomosp. 9 TaxID=1416803 RepID=UPI0015C5916B|nr:tripartite tricarboxylate transporter substrate binding protein [Bordetella genomosp. 9]